MKMNKKALAVLSVAHFVTDINQGALPALLPFFKESMHLSYTMAGVILLFGNLTSSVIQPVFGYFSDKKPFGWFLALAPVIACLGLAVTGVTSSYIVLIPGVIVSGFGIASFHPEGFKAAHYFTGERKATGMSIFAVGGNGGIALGPVFALALVTAFGLKGTLGMAVPGVVVTVILLFCLPWLTAPLRSAHSQTAGEKKKPLTGAQKKSLLLLVSIVMVRSWSQLGMVSYIPFYYINYLKGNPLYAGKLVTTFLLSGAVGALIGSPIADRWGHKNFLMATMGLTFPFFLLFYNSSGVLSIVSLAIAGMSLIASFALTTVMAQALLPEHLGMASGIIGGFAIGTGGIGVTLLGTVADHWGVPMALKVIFVLPLVAFVLCSFMKYPSPKRA
jgi:FSR family fosmidomycin resistance protein-like MFS transporter